MNANAPIAIAITMINLKRPSTPYLYVFETK